MATPAQAPINKTPITKAPNKTTCAMTREDFRAKAAPLAIKIGDQTVTGEVKEFSTGSFGWYSNAKVTLMVDGKPLTAQVGLNLIVVGSKEAAK